MRAFHHRIAGLCLAATMVGIPVLADPGTSTADQRQLREQVDDLKAQIEKFQKMLDETRDERSDLEKNLKNNEKRISELLKKIEKIKRELKDGEANITRLEQRQRTLDRARVDQQAQITKQIRAAWETGNQGYLKVLLNQEDPHQISRMLTYYDYFNRARVDRIHEYTKTIESLRDVERQIAEQNSRLTDERAQLEVRSKALVKARKEKQRALAALNRQINQTGTELEKRVADRARLEALLQKINERIATIPAPGDTAPFVTQKGKLLLPVAGQVTDRFGSARNNGQLRWHGVFIEAERGTPVHAIHYGRVVFSDWLRGFGLLLIINHGDGYMSLYGHNQVLYRETGDWVKAGEIIATVGNSGGQNRSGVYFEIRHAGKPTDPQLWCQARPRRSA